MPVVHNPFPQLSRVAVAPFLNLSDEPTVDGRKFALAYFSELQAVPGFEVAPLGVVEEMMIAEGIDLSSPGDARRLAKLLGVDAVVVGAVTDYSPYYPPRCGLRVEWYTANPGFHAIPAGYGLPWGTPDEEYIRPDIVFDAEMALARAQMATQSPVCVDDVAPPAALSSVPEARPLQPPRVPPAEVSSPYAPLQSRPELLPPLPDEDAPQAPQAADQAAFELPYGPALAEPALGAIDTRGAIDPLLENNFGGGLPPDWPDPRGFIPPGPLPARPDCLPSAGPVMTHTRIFLGHDPEFTSALAAYVDFRDDARFGGWRSYLERSDDFIRFCCHLHISDMLAARGGATETRVVRHWPNGR